MCFTAAATVAAAAAAARVARFITDRVARARPRTPGEEVGQALVLLRPTVSTAGKLVVIWVWGILWLWAQSMHWLLWFGCRLAGRRARRLRTGRVTGGN